MDPLEQARKNVLEYVEKTFDKFIEQKNECSSDFEDVTTDDYIQWFWESC